MTTNPSPAVPLRLTEPSELLAAVPVLLGFRPAHSLVLVAMHPTSTGRHRLGLGLRADLPPPRQVAAAAAGAADALLLDHPAEAVVIVVGEGPDGRPPGRPTARRRAPGSRSRRRRPAGPPRRDVAEAAVAALRARGVAARSVLWMQRCAAGAPWACYDGCCSGTLADPAGTRCAARAVTEGMVTYADRAEMEALVAPVAPGVLRRREALLERALAAAAAPGAPAAAPGEQAGPGVPVEPVEAALRRLDTAVDAAHRGELRLDDEAVVALALALGLPEVRDVALRLCVGPYATAAEQLWGALARGTPEPEAAVPAALLAISALARGCGALANIALDRAERAWPGHHLTGLLSTAVAGGIRPEEVRAWLAT